MHTAKIGEIFLVGQLIHLTHQLLVLFLYYSLTFVAECKYGAVFYQTQYRLEKVTHFRDLLFLLAARTSQMLNYQSLANDLGVSVPAIKFWVKILEASQIIFLLRPYYVNLGSRLVKAPKVYFTDICRHQRVFDIFHQRKSSLFIFWHLEPTV